MAKSKGRSQAQIVRQDVPVHTKLANSQVLVQASLAKLQVLVQEQLGKPQVPIWKKELSKRATWQLPALIPRCIYIMQEELLGDKILVTTVNA